MVFGGGGGTLRELRWEHYDGVGYPMVMGDLRESPMGPLQ